MKKMMLAALLAGGLMFTGCDEKKKEGGAATAGSAEKGGGDKKAAGGGGDIGVPECDDYIKKMEACLGKVPAEAKGAMESAFKHSRDAWKQAAATPAGKEGLKTACKAAADAMANNPMCK